MKTPFPSPAVRPSPRASVASAIAVVAACLLLGSCASMASYQQEQQRRAEDARAVNEERNLWGAMDRSKGAGMDEWIPKALAHATRDEGATMLSRPTVEWMAHASEMCLKYKRLDLLQAVRDHGSALIAGVPLGSLVSDPAPGKDSEMEDFLRIKQAYPADSMSCFTAESTPVLWLSDSGALALYDRFEAVVMAALGDGMSPPPFAKFTRDNGIHTIDYHVPLAEQLELDAKWVEPLSPALAGKMRAIRLEVLQNTYLMIFYPNGVQSTIWEFERKYPEVADYPMREDAKRLAALRLEKAGKLAGAAKVYKQLGDTNHYDQLVAKAKADLSLYLSRMPDFIELASRTSDPEKLLPNLDDWASPLYRMENNIPPEAYDAKTRLGLAKAYFTVASAYAALGNSLMSRLDSDAKDEDVRPLYRCLCSLSNYATGASLTFGKIPGYESEADLFNRVGIKANNDRLELMKLHPGAAR